MLWRPRFVYGTISATGSVPQYLVNSTAWVDAGRHIWFRSLGQCDSNMRLCDDCHDIHCHLRDRTRWRRAGDQSDPFVKLESNSQTRCADTLDASIWATINFERAAGCYCCHGATCRLASCGVSQRIVFPGPIGRGPWRHRGVR